MPPFPKPQDPFAVNLSSEKKNLDHYRKNKPGRAIPASSSKNLTIATWNIANLGVQEREDVHYVLIAKMIGWFDLIGVQEVNDDLQGLRSIMGHLPSKYKVIFSDASGNNERMAFIYNTKKLSLGEKIGEIAIPVEDLSDIKLEGMVTPFAGFSRSPYLVSFSWNSEKWVLIGVHSYFGSDNDTVSMERRSLEAYAVGRWADLRRRSKNCYTSNIIALGDFNLPKVDPSDPVYKALINRGLELPEHSTRIYSNISDDKDYDQIAFLPGIKSRITSTGVFDFDGALFPQLWNEANPLILRNYLRYYISDHRIKWMELKK